MPRFITPDFSQCHFKNNWNLMMFLNRHITLHIEEREGKDALDCSCSSFYRLIREHHQLLPTEFMQNVRIQVAKNILSQPGASVRDACYKRGFNSLNYFSKVFKKTTGTTPSDFVGTTDFD